MAYFTGENAEEHSLWSQFNDSRRYFDRDQLAHFYEPLARSIAARLYKQRPTDAIAFEDYLQYSRVGLLEAVERYEWKRGVRFSIYATARIRGAILNGIVRESELAAQNKYRRAQSRDRLTSFTSQLEDAERASLEEIAGIAMYLAIGTLLDQSVDVLEQPDTNQRNDPYASNELHQLIACVKRLIDQLPIQEKAVVTDHYIQHIEFQQVATNMGLSKGRVSQIHAQALKRLRGWLDDRPRLDSKI
jgi:RNA polymerase sigma factor FliA